MEKASLDNNWFYEGDGEKKGPITEKEIGELIRSGTVSTKSHVWKQGFTDWKSVDETELNVYVDKSVPPAMPVKSVMAWLLAFLPFYGTIFYSFLIGFYQGYAGYGATYKGLMMVSLLYLVIGIPFYIWLLISDEKLIKKAGYQDKVNRWTWLCTPVYLYKRAKLLKQNLLFMFVYFGSAVVSTLFL